MKCSRYNDGFIVEWVERALSNGTSKVHIWEMKEFANFDRKLRSRDRILDLNTPFKVLFQKNH